MEEQREQKKQSLLFHFLSGGIVYLLLYIAMIKSVPLILDTMGKSVVISIHISNWNLGQMYRSPQSFGGIMTWAGFIVSICLGGIISMFKRK